MNPFYNPGYGSYPVQPRQAAYDTQRMGAMMAPGLRGRMVMGVEEARAAQIDFDGSVSYFPSPAEGRIYAKSIDLNGMPVFLTYALQENPQPAADGSALADIRSRLSAVEKVLEELGYDKSDSAVGNGPAK